MSVNRVFLVGFVGRDPELRYTGAGRALCKFTVATVERRKKEEHTTWHDITCWGDQAEWASGNVHKGTQLYIEGSITVSTWKDKQGNNRKSVSVTPRDIKLIGRDANGDARPMVDIEDLEGGNIEGEEAF